MGQRCILILNLNATKLNYIQNYGVKSDESLEMYGNKPSPIDKRGSMLCRNVAKALAVLKQNSSENVL